jgi:hypothetical protein
VTETEYEYDDQNRIVRSLSVAEPEWTDTDRGLVLALLAERRDTCPSCGHPMSQCRDRRTAGTWQVVQEVCQPTRVAQAVAEDVRDSKRRGVVLLTRQTPGSQHA